MWVILALLLTLSSFAASLGGVSFPETARAGEQELVLMGLGVREKLFIDIYVGALYVTDTQLSAEEIVASDVPKRVVMHVVYRELTRDQLVATMWEGYERYPEYADQRDKLEQLLSYFQPVQAGDVVVVDYHPDRGTCFSLNGQEYPCIQGQEFQELVFSIYLGPRPSSESLKRGLLGE